MEEFMRFNKLVETIEKAKRKKNFNAMVSPLSELIAIISHVTLKEPEASTKLQYFYKKLDGCYSISIEPILQQNRGGIATLVLMGDIHRIYGNETKALQYFKRYWQLLIDDKILDKHMDQVDKFLEIITIYYKNMEAMKMYDIALVNFNKALNVFEYRNLPRKNEFSTLLHLKGKALSNLQKYDESLKVLKRGLKSMKKTKQKNHHDATIVLEICLDIGNVYSKLGQSVLAIDHLQIVLNWVMDG